MLSGPQGCDGKKKVRNQDKNPSLSKASWCLNSHIRKESELRLGLRSSILPHVLYREYLAKMFVKTERGKRKKQDIVRKIFDFCKLKILPPAHLHGFLQTRGKRAHPV